MDPLNPEQGRDEPGKSPATHVRAGFRWVVPAILCLALTLAPLSAADDSCPEGNLLEAPGVLVSGGGPGAPRTIDGRFESEGGSSGALAVHLDSPLQIDMGTPRTIGAMLLQADGDDDYVVEGSIDGVSWAPLAMAGAAGAGGMRSRALRLPEPARVRYLRVSGSGGDGSFSVSEIAAWCGVPERPTEADLPKASGLWPRGAVRGVQLGTALLGTLLLGWGLVLRRLGREDRSKRTRDVGLAALGILAGLCWWNLGAFHFGNYLHLADHYHYFLGAKYFDELEHTRLYECTAAADVEQGLGEIVRQRRIRDLQTNRLVSAEWIVNDPGSCKAQFTTERWEQFGRDVDWFRRAIPPPMWERMFVDHGYNASPAWGILGTSFSRLVPANDATILALGLIDPLLLLVMWGLVIWAFGWRTACIAALWWGTNQLEGFPWTGGAFLRQDWLVLSIAGICLVRQRRMAAGGFALTYATLLRVFPGFIVAALVLRAATRVWRGIRTGNGTAVAREYVSFAAGCLLALFLLVPLSIWTSGGPAAWGAFAENSKANLRSTGANMVGLMVVLSYEHENRWEVLADPERLNPELKWLEAKRDVYERRRPLFWLLSLGFVWLLWRAVKDEPDWVALTLGIGLIPIASFPACYYFSILLGYGLLLERRKEGVGMLLCALSVVTHLAFLAYPSGLFYDQRYGLDSLAVVLFVVLVSVRRWWPPSAPA